MPEKKRMITVTSKKSIERRPSKSVSHPASARDKNRTMKPHKVLPFMVLTTWVLPNLPNLTEITGWISHSFKLDN